MEIAPLVFDPTLIDMVERYAESLGHPVMRLPPAQATMRATSPISARPA